MKSDKNSWILTMVLSSALFMENMDSNVISTSLPAIAYDIHTDPISLKLAMTSYMVALSIFIPISGWASDNFSSKKTFKCAVITFLIGSVLCSLAHSLLYFVFARFVQGMGGAMMVPVGRLVLLRNTSKDNLVSALSLFSITALVGPLVGPLIGGFITTYFTWHWIFLINVPIGIIGLIFADIYMPTDEELYRSSLNIKDFLLLSISFSSFIFGISIINIIGFPKIYGTSLITIGLVSSYIYYCYAKSAKNPIMDIKIFKNQVFCKSIIGGILFRTGIGAIPFFLPLMVQLCFHLSPMQSGLITFTAAIGAISMKFIVQAILNTAGFYNTAVYGTMICALFTSVYAFITSDTPYWILIPVVFSGGLLRAMFFSCINAIGFSEINKKNMSKANPIYAVAQQSSIATGIAVGGIILETLISIHGGEVRLSDFHIGFIIISLISLSSVLVFATFDKNVGASLQKSKTSKV